MEATNIMEIIQFLALEIVIPLAIVAVMHFVIRKYPDPLPLEENKRKGGEILAIFGF